MTASARKSVLVLLLTAVGCAAEGPLGDTEGSTWATHERALDAVECITPPLDDPDQAICSGTIPAVSSCFVSLGSDRLRREIAQTFKVNRKGQAGRIRLKLKRLQEVPVDPSEQSDLLLELRTVTDGFIPLDPAATFASARIDRDRLLTLPDDDGYFEVFMTSAPPPYTKVMDPKEEYALIIRIEEGHSMAVGIACHEDPEGSEVPYANGRAYSRQMRKVTATEFTDPQFIADTRDLSFSLSLDDGCIKDKMIECGIGECFNTVPQCIEGIPQVCTALPPSPEICDLLDNDCDGEVDELEDLGTTSCGVGECSRTVNNCVDGVTQTCVPGPKGVEVCNGKDDDCDGEVDDIDELGQTSCGVGVCGVTVDNCVGGAANACNPNLGARTTETCNGIDDDCDGSFDENESGTKLTQAYWPAGYESNRGKGVCKDGVQTCVTPKSPDPHVPQDALWSITTVPILPSTEVCNNKDDDCDGLVDENLFEACYTVPFNKRNVGRCKDGQSQCSAGTWGACVGEIKDTVETCNGIDDDCNGIIDDGLGQTSCGFGACRVTTNNCVNGMPNNCTPDFTKATVEVCDGIDNDCDGIVDNITQDCYTGSPADSWTEGVCQRGTQTCTNGVWGPCLGEVTPAAKDVCNNLDDDCDGVTDNPRTSACVAPPNTQVTATDCASGICHVKGCTETSTTKYYDYDNNFSNGCELAADKHPNTCNAANLMVTMDYNSTRPVTISGYLPEPGQSDWFIIDFPLNHVNETWYSPVTGSPHYEPTQQTHQRGTPSISFASNPGSQFRFRVMENNCTNFFDPKVQTVCGSGGPGRLTSWSYKDNTCYNNSLNNSKCITNKSGWPTRVRVEVFHDKGFATNAQYTLSITR